jgi:hypothetical protein
MDSGLPSDVLDIFRNEFSNTKQSNWDILTDEERNRQILWLENEYGSKKMSVSYSDYNAPVEEAIPMNEEVPIRNIRRRLTPVRRVTIDAEAELTRILEEQIMDEISSETLREITSDMRYNDVYGGDEYGGEEYPDQAG